jgi:hypothetical protein
MIWPHDKRHYRPEPFSTPVIPAKAGIHVSLMTRFQPGLASMDSRFRGNDGGTVIAVDENNLMRQDR